MLYNANDIPSSKGETSNAAAYDKIIKGDSGELRCLNYRHGFLGTKLNVQWIMVE